MAEKAKKLESLEKKSQISPKQEVNDSQLHWFWRLTTKWWFFPLFYFILALILALLAFIQDPSHIWGYIFLSIILMPQGLIGFLTVLLSSHGNVVNLQQELGFSNFVVLYFAIAVIIIISYSWIIYSKYRLNKVLKWLIIILMLIIILSFSGCILEQIDLVGTGW